MEAWEIAEVFFIFFIFIFIFIFIFSVGSTDEDLFCFLFWEVYLKIISFLGKCLWRVILRNKKKESKVVVFSFIFG